MASIDIYPTQDGFWSYIEATGCAGTNTTGTTFTISDNHSVGSPAESYGGLEFDLSGIPVGSTINTVSLRTYAHSFSKTRGLSVTWTVVYYYQTMVLGANPFTCTEFFGGTLDGSLNWSGTVGWKAKSISTAAITPGGNVSFRLQAGWRHVASGKYAAAEARAVEYAGTSSDPILRIDYTPPSVGGPPLRTLMGVGL